MVVSGIGKVKMGNRGREGIRYGGIRYREGENGK